MQKDSKYWKAKGEFSLNIEYTTDMLLQNVDAVRKYGLYPNIIRQCRDLILWEQYIKICLYTKMTL